MNNFAFSVVQHVVGVASLIVIAAMLRWGRTPERIAAAAFAFTMYGTPFLSWIQIGGQRVAVSAISLGLFATLLVLALRTDRWWLLAASGAQLLSICIWGLSFATRDVELWAGVTVRLIVWILLMITGVVGVFEARQAPYARDP